MVRASSCLAVGYRTPVVDFNFTAIAEHWNGHRWSVISPKHLPAFAELAGVSCPAARSCYAAGWASRTRFGTQHPLIEHWNGITWSARKVGKPSAYADLRSISCPTTTSCTAVGSLGNDNTRPLVEDLSKGKWTEGLPGAPGIEAGRLTTTPSPAPRRGSAPRW